MKFIKAKIILIFLLLVLTIVSFVGLFLDKQYKNGKPIELTESIISQQSELETNFKIEGYTLDNPNIIVNPYGNSPLTALVLFQTEDEITPVITITGKDEQTTMFVKGNKGTDHYVPIYGLYAGRENYVSIEAGNKLKTLSIKTDELPEDIAIPTNVIANKDKLNNELYFFTPSSKGYTSAYDVNGDVRWFLTDKMTWDISRLKNGRLLLSTERPINPPYFTTGLYEVDLLGKVYKEYSLPGGYHHDFFEMEDGNLLIASNEFDNKDGTVEDIIVEIDRNSGNIIKTWDLKDVLNMEDGKGESWSDYDWFHNNSVWYDEKENAIILSGRHQDAVIAIDYTSKNLKWIIGDPTTWSESYHKYFFKPLTDNGDFEWQWSQHAAMVTPEGYIFILDNGNNKSKITDEYVSAKNSYTRGVMYEIDTVDMTIKQIWQYGKERGSEFYSPYISDVDYLNKDHYIVHSGGIVYVDGEISNQPAGFSKDEKVGMYSTTVELLNNEVIFELTLPTNMYRSEKMSLYNDSIFHVGKADNLGCLGKTQINENKLGLPLGAIKTNDEYEKYNINLTKEEDRLVLKGDFSKEDEVTLILYNHFKMKRYNVRVSKRPYTALCIDIFAQAQHGNTLEVDKYINKKELTGNYSVYLEINNILYNTETYVDFE